MVIASVIYCSFPNFLTDFTEGIHKVRQYLFICIICKIFPKKLYLGCKMSTNENLESDMG